MLIKTSVKGINETDLANCGGQFYRKLVMAKSDVLALEFEHGYRVS